MAYCANCGTNISDLAERCPSCGHPQQIAAVPPLADFWPRFAARLIDGIILLIPTFLFGNQRFGGLVIGFLYHWLMLAFNDGRTVGKMAMGIRIARPNGASLDIGTAAAREGMAIVSGIPLGLGFLWAAWDPERRTWHDMVADTRAFADRR